MPGFFRPSKAQGLGRSSTYGLLRTGVNLSLQNVSEPRSGDIIWPTVEPWDNAICFL